MQKISLLQEFYKTYQKKDYFLESDFIPNSDENFFRDDFLTVVSVQEQPARKKLNTLTGRQELIHSILHIEYVAIDLALQSILQFPQMPFNYQQDWLEVAIEEVEHFLALQEILKKLGIAYGDLPVHISLYLAASKPKTVLERMAVVPRFLEAGGLDANPFLVERLSGFNDSFSSKARETLSVILKDEIDHVRKGDYWFQFLCRQEGISPDSFFEAVKKNLPSAQIPKKKINREARLQAGYTEKELDILQGLS